MQRDNVAFGEGQGEGTIPSSPVEGPHKNDNKTITRPGMLLGRLRQENRLNPEGGGCEKGFRYVAQSGLGFLSSSNPPALASQSVGITGRGGWITRGQDQPGQHGETSSPLKKPGCGGRCLWSQLLGRLRQNYLNLGGKSYSELRSQHCTPA
ncbi:hypothetical protein AAY473_009497 [Plecturocebus cupreus]